MVKKIAKKPINSIEINGKRYDAQTGKPLTAVGIKPVTKAVSAAAKPVTSQITTHAKHPLSSATPIQPISDTKLMDMKPPKRSSRSTAKAAHSHQPQTARTLMRHVVKKPAPSLKRHTTAQGHTDGSVSTPTTAPNVEPSAPSLSAGRQRRAKTIKKSLHITHFSRPKAAQPGHIYSPSQPESHNSNVAPVVSAPAVHTANRQPLDIFEQALQRATSHQQPPVAPAKHFHGHSSISKRTAGIATTVLAVLLLASFIGFESRGTLALRLAAQKAGFSASLPAYRPVGFSLGRLNYSPGTVAISFHGNGDQRSFAIIEKPSEWDSATLRDDFVASADAQYQTTQVGGQTVYLYGNHAATWVTGGIWYQVNSNGALSDQQLTHLASSVD